MKSIGSQIFTVATSFLICGYSISASADNREYGQRDSRGNENHREYNNHENENQDYNDHKDNRCDGDKHYNWNNRDNKRQDDYDHHEKEQGHFVKNNRFVVPPGYLPHPGECRVWYPERPANRQPHPYFRHRYFKGEPRDAYVVRCEPDIHNRLKVHLCLDGVEVAVQWYDSNNGAFLFENRW